MNKQQIVQLFGMITIVFPQTKQTYGTANQLMVDTWAELLEDVDFETVKQALYAHSVNSKFPPSIAEIRRYALKPAILESAEEAWARVTVAMRDGIYHSKERFEELPAVCKRLVGSPALLQDLARSEGEYSVSSFRKRFMEQYDNEKEQENKRALIPQSVRQALGVNLLEAGEE